MKVSFSPRALAQINQEFEYVAADNPAAANDFLIRVETIAGLLATRSGIGRKTSKSDVQFVGLLPFRYLMFFKTLPGRDEIRIIRVRHMRRRDAADVRGL
jgi:plasmid stabilization system protein ParE